MYVSTHVVVVVVVVVGYFRRGNSVTILYWVNPPWATLQPKGVKPCPPAGIKEGQLPVTTISVHNAAANSRGIKSPVVNMRHSGV